MADQVPDLPALKNDNLRFILIDSYSESSGRPGGRSSGRSTHPENGNLRFTLIDSYPENRPGRSSSRSTPQKMAISDSY